MQEGDIGCIAIDSVKGMLSSSPSATGQRSS